MPNFTAGYPKVTGNNKEDIKTLNDWAVSLTDELKYILTHLDETNLAESFINELKNTEENEEEQTE